MSQMSHRTALVFVVVVVSCVFFSVCECKAILHCFTFFSSFLVAHACRPPGPRARASDRATALVGRTPTADASAAGRAALGRQVAGRGTPGGALS